MRGGLRINRHAKIHYGGTVKRNEKKKIQKGRKVEIDIWSMNRCAKIHIRKTQRKYENPQKKKLKEKEGSVIVSLFSLFSGN